MDELLKLWMERDERYAMRRRNGMFIPLTDNEREAVITYRRKEALALPMPDQAKALTELSQWAR